jgi:hypothetical protein
VVYFQRGDEVAAVYGRHGQSNQWQLRGIDACTGYKCREDHNRFAVGGTRRSSRVVRDSVDFLYGNLQIEKGQTPVRRGGTSALGQAALNIAANPGLNVIATMRNQARYMYIPPLTASTWPVM